MYEYDDGLGFVNWTHVRTCLTYSLTHSLTSHLSGDAVAAFSTPVFSVSCRCTAVRQSSSACNYPRYQTRGGWLSEWLACWTQAQKGPGSNRSRDAVG